MCRAPTTISWLSPKAVLATHLACRCENILPCPDSLAFALLPHTYSYWKSLCLEAAGRRQLLPAAVRLYPLAAVACSTPRRSANAYHADLILCAFSSCWYRLQIGISSDMMRRLASRFFIVFLCVLGYEWLPSVFCPQSPQQLGVTAIEKMALNKDHPTTEPWSTITND